MKELTQEELKRFWEWCGFTKVHYNQLGNVGWKRSGVSEIVDNKAKWVNLELDLNNLFKYAVPKLSHFNMWAFEDTNAKRIKQGERRTGYICASAQLQLGQKPQHHVDRDPALALFWAIWKVIDDGNTTPTKH